MSQSTSSSLQPSPLSLWLIRLWLALLLGFGSEIFLWIDPPARPLLEWALLAVGYLALSAFLLDCLIRFRVVEIFGLLMLAGIYGLIAGLILNPDMALANMPTTLVTRVMGAHALVGLLMLLLFLALSGNYSGRAHIFFLTGCAVSGLAWGVWAHWYTVDLNGDQLALITMLLWGGAALILIIGLFALIVPRADRLSPAHLLLPLEQYIAVVGVLVALFAVRLAQNKIDSIALSAIPVLLAFCLVILWFQKRAKQVSLLDNRLPLKKPSLLWMLMLALLFLALGAVGYSLPRGPNPDSDQFGTLVALFSIYGLVWLPTACLVLGVRGYRRITRAGRL